MHIKTFLTKLGFIRVKYAYFLKCIKLAHLPLSMFSPIVISSSIKNQILENKLARKHIIKQTYFNNYIPNRIGLSESLNSITGLM